jgi:hypothetical protein
MTYKSLLLGRWLATHEQAEQKIGVVAGVPAIGLPLGALGLSYIGPIVLVILALLAILYVSYRQTIAAYPTGGGCTRSRRRTSAPILACSPLQHCCSITC